MNQCCTKQTTECACQRQEERTRYKVPKRSNSQANSKFSCKFVSNSNKQLKQITLEKASLEFLKDALLMHSCYV